MACRQRAMLETAVTAPRLEGIINTKEVPSPSMESAPTATADSRLRLQVLDTRGSGCHVVRPRLTETGTPGRTTSFGRYDQGEAAGRLDDMHAQPDLQPLKSRARLWGGHETPRVWSTPLSDLHGNGVGLRLLIDASDLPIFPISSPYETENRSPGGDWLGPKSLESNSY